METQALQYGETVVKETGTAVRISSSEGETITAVGRSSSKGDTGTVGNTG
jgi:hypothetical protein